MPIATVTVDSDSDWTRLTILDGSTWVMQEPDARIQVDGHATATTITRRQVGTSNQQFRQLPKRIVLQVNTGANGFFTFLCEKGSIGSTRIRTPFDDRINLNSGTGTNPARFTIFVAQPPLAAAADTQRADAGEFSEYGRYGGPAESTEAPPF